FSFGFSDLALFLGPLSPFFLSLPLAIHLSHLPQRFGKFLMCCSLNRPLPLHFSLSSILSSLPGVYESMDFIFSSARTASQHPQTPDLRMTFHLRRVLRPCNSF